MGAHPANGQLVDSSESAVVVAVAAPVIRVRPPGQAVAGVGLAAAGVADCPVRVQDWGRDVRPLLEEPPVRLGVHQELLRSAFRYGCVASADLGTGCRDDDGKEGTTQNENDP